MRFAGRYGFTFAGHPMACAIAMANIDAMQNEGVLENVRDNEAAFTDMLNSLRERMLDAALDPARFLAGAGPVFDRLEALPR